jgi:hypothetical protein
VYHETAKENMDEQTRATLADFAEAVDDLAFRLNEVTKEFYARLNELEDGPNDVPCRHVEDESRWMRGARRELAELIRSVEGPRPRQAPRRVP